jgi:hypothetical protein
MDRTWKIALAVAGLAAVALVVAAQQTPTPANPTAATKGVRISFLPPPMEGTLSLGIYDRAGKLVRVLHREADVDEFEIGSDSLATTWDGKNDAGESMPAGKYHARGYAVGDVDVEGVGYFFNDWVTNDDSPRITKMTEVALDDGGLTISGTLATAAAVTLSCSETGEIRATRSDALDERKCTSAAGLPGVVDPVDCATGKDQTIWVIDRAEGGTEVKQYSSSREFLRQLTIAPGDPQPRKIAASRTADRVFLLEEGERLQRLRALSLVATKSDAGQAVSDWKVEFEKKIVAHQDFGVENGKLVATGRSGDALEKVKVRLAANPLQDDKAGDVELIAGFDSDGALLKTADGLPLQTISETPGLKRVLLARAGEKALDLFQSDGAVVEQFRVSNLDQMMAFDAGEFELK